MLNFIPAGCTRILDVGCASGQFGRALKANRNIEVWGVEPIEMAAREAEENLDRVICGYFDEQANLPIAYFDAVIFNDSLEHFPDEYPPLRLAQTLLKPGGVVIVSLPNFRYLENIKHILFEKDFEYRDAGILDRTHLRFFTRKSMQRLFENAGFEILAMEGINPHWWSGWKIGLLRALFRHHIEDMKYLQYVTVARVRAVPADTAT